MKCDSQVVIRLDKPKIDLINGGLIYSIEVGCGKCYNCKLNRANSWSFRIMEELKTAYSSCFVTLTYMEPALSKRGFMTLDKAHVQGFIKRLRKIELDYEKKCGIEKVIGKKPKIKYFCAGEYGSDTRRPHLHLIIMNLMSTDTVYEAWKFGELYKVNEGTKLNPVYNEARQFYAGNIIIDDANINTIDYTVKYLSKDQTVNLFPKFDGLAEFNLQSKDLGKGYIRDETKSFHYSHLGNNYLVTHRGYKIPLGKYLRDKIYQCLFPYENSTGKLVRCGQCVNCIRKDKSIAYIKIALEQSEQDGMREARLDGKNYDKLEAGKAIMRQEKLKNSGKKRRELRN